MSKPAANHRHVNACRYQTGCGRVPKRVRGDSLTGEGRDLPGRCYHVLFQLETNACCSKWTSVTIHEDGFVFTARLSFQKFLEQRNSLWPKRTEAFFSSLGGHDQLQLMPPGWVKLSGLRIHTTRCLDGSTSSSRTAMAGEAIASISTTTQAGCGRSLPVGPTLSRTIRLW